MVARTYEPLQLRAYKTCCIKDRELNPIASLGSLVR